MLTQPEFSAKYKPRWLSLWPEHRMEDASIVFKSVVECWTESHRRYHTLEHLASCLEKFDSVKSLFDNPIGAEVALWFHDLVYDFAGVGNEKRSAVNAANMCRWLDRDEMASDVKRAVLATAHNAKPEAWDDRLVVDIDLSILGEPPDVFDEYERQVRQEYCHVSDDDFKAGRSKILLNFLGMQSIFNSRPFRLRYEAQARANMQNSLRKLSEQDGKGPNEDS